MTNGLLISMDTNGEMQLEIPGNVPHSIHIPFSMPGLMHLRNVLQSRLRDPAQKIGTCGTPTQAQTEEFIAAYFKRNPPQAAPKPTSHLASLLSDIDLDL